MHETLPSSSVPFSFFVSLLSEISKIGPKSRSTRSLSTIYPALQTFQNWIAELHRKFGPDIPSETVVIIFRLLFPEDDVRRKYDMQEPRLAQYLAHALGVSSNIGGRGAVLHEWSKSDSLGCLGTEIKKVMQASATEAVDIGTLTIHEVDSFLDQLASLSSFSHDSVRRNRGSSSSLLCSRTQILRTLFSSISPIEASFLTQIILKDLRPVLYPVAETHYTAALKQYKSNAITMLTVHDALRAWDPSNQLLERWRLVSRLEEALDHNDDGPVCIFTPLQIPKAIKGTGCARALGYFPRARRVWAETKYDGERAQIHVKIDQATGFADIRIFSKSKRDSTKDRFGIHSVIRNALGLGDVGPPHARLGMRTIERDIIVEAEMVAFSDPLGRIDEFWRIRSLIESTAQGPRSRKSRKSNPISVLPIDSQCSMLSDASDGGNRHLALVFFDILYLDSVSLTSNPYSSRRTLLESIVRTIPGYSMIAERSLVDLQRTAGDAGGELRAILARVVSDHQEGLVLKAEDGQYIKSPWVKLKKDYIPLLGDCLDCVIVGARWDKDRGRELRVPPSTYTTFYLGLLANEDAIKKDPNALPHFEVFFTVSYGLNREQLEDLNFMIKNSDSLNYDQVRKNPKQPAYTYNLFSGLSFPDIVLEKHDLLLTEVFGAGFTKAPQNKYYELRFPRMTKVFRRGERSWIDGSSLKEFQRVARESVGRERPNKDVDDWCKGLWGKPISPGVKNPIRRKYRESMLLADLENADKKRKRSLNDDDDDGSVKQYATRKNDVISLPQTLTVSRALQPLDSRTNVPSFKEGPSVFNKDSNLTQTPLDKEQSNASTPPVRMPLSPPTTTPKRKRSNKAPSSAVDHSPSIGLNITANRMIGDKFIAATPLPIMGPPLSVPRRETPPKESSSFAVEHQAQRSPFIDLVKEKRKRELDDASGSVRKRRLLKYQSVNSLSFADFAFAHKNEVPTTSNGRSSPQQGVLPLTPAPSAFGQERRCGVSKLASATSAGDDAGVLWKIPAPPPPGASGWHRCATSAYVGLNDSDKMALYNGATAFYVDLPRWEHPGEPLESPLESRKASTSPVSPVRTSEPAISAKMPRLGMFSMFKQQELLFAGTAAGQLLATSVVWFARDLEITIPEHRSLWGQIVPQTNMVTRLEALLVGCGWHMLMNTRFTSKKGIERGVAFIDFEEEGEVAGRVKMAEVVKKCEERWSKIIQWKETEEMKPIWMVDARMLRRDVLEDGGGLEHLEQFVLWKKG